MEQIERHVAALTRHLFRSLKALRHRNGAPFALLYWGRKEDPSGTCVVNTTEQASRKRRQGGQLETTGRPLGEFAFPSPVHIPL